MNRRHDVWLKHPGAAFGVTLLGVDALVFIALAAYWWFR